MHMDGTVIVTGATGALGQALLKNALQRPETHTLLATTSYRASARATQLQQILDSYDKGQHASIVEVDLADQDSIHTFASDINSKVSAGKLPPIRALVLNAAFFFERNGLKFAGRDPRTGDPFEMHFLVNYLGNFLLSLLLLESMDRKRGRIVYVSSWAHDPSRRENKRFGPDKLSWNVEDLAHPVTSKLASDVSAEAMRRYGASKLALVTFMHALQQRLTETRDLDNIRIVGVDPGAMLHSNIAEKTSTFERFTMVPLIQLYTRIAQYINPNGMFRTVEKSAEDVLRAAFETTDPYLARDAYFDGNRPAETAVESKDLERQKELWQLSLLYVGLEERETALGPARCGTP